MKVVGDHGNRYSDTQKRAAVLRANEVGPGPAARELGVGVRTLFIWRQKAARP